VTPGERIETVTLEAMSGQLELTVEHPMPG